MIIITIGVCKQWILYVNRTAYVYEMSGYATHMH